MNLPCEIPQLDIPDVGRNHIILYFFLVSVRKIISVQEIYSESLFGSTKSQRQINTANPDIRDKIQHSQLSCPAKNQISLVLSANSIFSSSRLYIYSSVLPYLLI